MYPDIVKSRADEVDRKAKRKVINLQKRKLKEDKKLADRLKEREVIGMTSLNNLQTGYAALDMDDPKFPSQWRKLVKDNITGIGMSKRSLEGFNTIKSTVIENEAFKAKEVAETEAWVAGAWWNENNAFNKITPESPPELLKEAGDAYKKHLQEEKNKVTRADVVATAEAQVGVADEAKFKAFVEETGSAFNPEDFNKPEAKTALRIHKQTEEVKKLIMTVGEDGLPIMAKLRIKPDGSGYENHLDVLAELTTLSNKQKTDRGIKGKSLSEQQGNALMYSERLKFANETMDRKVLEGVAPGQDILNNLLTEATGTKTFSFFNAVIDPKFQVWKSAADNFIRATLRKESGAAIADHEYIGGFKDYIPLMGDSKELVGHKRTLRKGISDTMRRVSSVPWDESYLPSQPLRFQSREQAERFLRKGGWLEEGTKAEYKDGGKIIPFTVTDKRKKKPANKAVPKLGSEALADPRTNPLLKGAVNPTSIRP